MKKVLIFAAAAILVLSLLTGCRDMSNVSDASDGSVTSGSAGSAVEDVSEMVSELMETTEAPETSSEPSGKSMYGRRDISCMISF